VTPDEVRKAIRDVTRLWVFLGLVGIAVGATWPIPVLVLALLTFAFVVRLRRRLPEEYFVRTSLLTGGLILGSVLGFAIASHEKAEGRSQVEAVRRAGVEFVQAPSDAVRIERLDHLEHVLDSATLADKDTLAPYTPPFELRHLRARWTSDDCPIPEQPARPVEPNPPKLPPKATISISGRFIRTQTGTFGSTREILVQDGDRYFVVKDADPAWFLGGGSNYVQLTGDTKDVDIADGRSATVALVSDREAFLETERQMGAMRAKADKIYKVDVALYELDTLARQAAIDGRSACLAEAAALRPELWRKLVGAADRFAVKVPIRAQ
jgi:hypothetical protein